MGKNTIFVSYRRTDLNGKTSGTNIARTIKQHLEISGYENRVFFDYCDLSDDEFENIILSEIRGCKVFILVLTRDTMHRCVNDDDWVRREILEAAKHNVKIVPIEVDNLFNGYPEGMISDLDIIKRLQHSKVHMDSSFENDMNAIIEARIAPVVKPHKSNKLKHILIASFAIIALVLAGWLIAKASNSVSDVEEPESKPIIAIPKDSTKITISDIMEYEAALKRQQQLEATREKIQGLENYLKAISGIEIDGMIFNGYRSDDSIVYEYYFDNVNMEELTYTQQQELTKNLYSQMEEFRPSIIQQMADLYISGQNSEEDKDIVLAIDLEMSFIYNCKDINDFIILSEKISSAEVLEVVDELQELLEIDGYLKAISNECPVDIGDGTILMEVYRYDDTIIYEYNLSNIDTRVLSEEEFNDCIKSCTAEMKQMKPILTQNWAELYLLGLKDEACSDIVQYVECGMNVAYHFRDSNGIRLYTIKISNSEIWDAIEKKQNY